MGKPSERPGWVAMKRGAGGVLQLLLSSCKWWSQPWADRCWAVFKL